MNILPTGRALRPRSSPGSARRRLLRGCGALAMSALGGCGGGPNPVPVAAACSSTPVLQSARRAAPRAHAFPDSEAAPGAPLPELPRAAQLQAQLHRAHHALQAPAIDAALLVPGVGQWQGRIGWADRPARRPVQPDTEFWWASCGKAVTASLVLQAEHAGLLRQQDRLERWFPDEPHADITRLVDLLQHTTHWRSYNDPSIGSDPLDSYLRPDELLERVRGASRLACPGLHFRYSNTNYLLLALVLERVWGLRFAQLVDEHIGAPLGLQLRALAPREQPARLALAHDAQGQVLRQPGLSGLIGAGNLVGSAGDWAQLWLALVDGRLAGAAAPRWSTLLDMALPGHDSRMWYGQGVMLIDWRDPLGRDRLWLCHTGGARDTSNSVVFWDPLLRCCGAVAVNGPASAAAVANALLSAFEPG